MAFLRSSSCFDKSAANSGIERISFFGLGKLGLPLAALFARSGLRVVGIDINAGLVEKLRAGMVPIAEPGLDEILAEAVPFITYTTDIGEAANTDASIILVETASDGTNSGYSSNRVESACMDLCAALRARPVWRYHLIVIASTLLPGSISTIVPNLEEALGQSAGRDFGIAYVPEFVGLGKVVKGFTHPSFLLIGSDDPRAATHTAGLYRRIVAPETPLRIQSLWDAELTKIALNMFLCMKVSFGNFLAQLCEHLGGADLDAIANTLSLDSRVGAGLLRGGTPYGGPCLPHDTEAFVHLAQLAGLDALLAKATAEVNAAQFDLIERCVLAGSPRCVAVLGLSLKPGTPATDGSPAFEFVRRLLRASIQVVAFDPFEKACAVAQAKFGLSITCFNSLAICVASADTILICNPDPSFSGLATKVPPDRRIVDPWGFLCGTHPGLMQPGRGKSRPVTESVHALVELP